MAMKKCPNCGKLIKGACPHCGTMGGKGRSKIMDVNVAAHGSGKGLRFDAASKTKKIAWG